MATIDVDIHSARAATTQVPPIVNTVAGASLRLNILQSSIDPRVLNHHNLRSRLASVRNEVVSIEDQLKNLHTSVMSMLERYEMTDADLLNKINSKNLGLTRR